MGFLVNDEALVIHCSTVSPLSFINSPMFYIPSLNASFPVRSVCHWSVFILSSEYFSPLQSVIPSLLSIHSFEYFFPFLVIILSVLCIDSFFEYIFPLPFVIPPVLSVHSSITRGGDDRPISPLYEVTWSPQAPRMKSTLCLYFLHDKGVELIPCNTLGYASIRKLSKPISRYVAISRYITCESKVIRNNAISDYVVVK